MKGLLSIFFFSLSLLFVTSCATSIAKTAKRPCIHDRKNLRCVQYIETRDGDTVNFNIPDIHPLIGESIGVRVLGVDTPEKGGKAKCEKEKAKAEKVKQLVHRLLKKAKRIDLEDVSRGSFFRVVADIRFDGKSLSQYLLTNGLAYPYKKGTKRDWCKPTQRTSSGKRR